MATGLNLDIQTWGTQLAFINDTSKFTALIGGVGSGKTRGGALKAAMYCVRNNKADLLVTAPTYRMLMAPGATIDSYRSVLAPITLDYVRGAPTGPMLQLITGNRIFFRSTDEPDNLRGPSIGAFHMDEAAMSPYEAYTILLARLRQPDVPLCGWFTSTPRGYNWLYHEIKDNDVKVYTIATSDNPFLPAEYIKTLRAKYDRPGMREFMLQELEGQFVVISGNCIFDIDSLNYYRTQTRPPIEVRENGLVKIWAKPVIGVHYVGACDVAEGVGGDASCFKIAAVGAQSMEVVCSVYSHNIHTNDFAVLISKLSTEYRNCFVMPEANAIGEGVCRKLIELGTPIYYRDVNKKLPGWKTTTGNRFWLLDEFEESIRQRSWILPEREDIEECFSFVRDEKGNIGAHEGAHDDRVFTLALLWQARKYASYNNDMTYRPPLSFMKD